MSDGIATDKTVSEQQYPLSQRLNVNFNAYEDRLVVRAERLGKDPVRLLFTRRMTILVLRQTLARLPELSALEKTPAAYWQEVLQIGHQHAMQTKADARKARQQENEDLTTAGSDDDDTGKVKDNTQVYLATEITVNLNKQRLMLAFRGLLMPDAMTQPAKHEPVLAIPLTVENVHQLIELLIVKSQQAQWHLPVNLPWMSETPVESPKKPMN